MQAVKEKLNEMSAIRKAKASAKAEEKAEKEMAKTRADVAHEVRLAREAEAEMQLHMAKAEEKMEREITKHASQTRPQDANDNVHEIYAAAAAITTPSTAGPGPHGHAANQYL